MTYLSGVRVLDLSRILAGPYAASVLAELGADVIKVEGPAGDPARQIGPFVEGESLYYQSLNRGKRGIILDLRSEGDQAALYRLVESADILIHNYLPHVALRLGVSAPLLQRLRPELTVVAVSSYATDTSWSGRAALDITVQAGAGIMAVTGLDGAPPVRAGVPIGDLMAGMWAALGATSGYVQRLRTGRGSDIEVPLFDAALSSLTYIATAAMATGSDPKPVGSGHHSAVPYGAFPARDGWVALGLIGDRLFPILCDVLGLTEFASEPTLQDNAGRQRQRQQLEEKIAQRTMQFSKAELVERLSSAGIPAAPVNSVLDALRSSYTRERELVATMAGQGAEYHVVRAPLPVPAGDLRAAPRLGEHTAEVLKHGW